jgi:hypothetical protein
MRLLQEQDAETDATRRRKDELISVQQTREKSFNNSQLCQDKIKEAFDRHTKVDDFKLERCYHHNNFLMESKSRDLVRGQIGVETR